MSDCIEHGPSLNLYHIEHILPLFWNKLALTYLKAVKPISGIDFNQDYSKNLQVRLAWVP